MGRVQGHQGKLGVDEGDSTAETQLLSGRQSGNRGGHELEKAGLLGEGLELGGVLLGVLEDLIGFQVGHGIGLLTLLRLKEPMLLVQVPESEDELGLLRCIT